MDEKLIAQLKELAERRVWADELDSFDNDTLVDDFAGGMGCKR